MKSKEIKSAQHDLSKKIEGSILDTGDLGYIDTITIDNSRVRHEPCLVALPSTARDVAEIIKYCTKHSIPLTTKSGGHSAAGYCLNSEGIVMDMATISDISSIDNGKALSIGAGARWIRAYNFLRDRQSDYTVIGGGCAGVGVAGFILGGGYSFISRSYGLGSDNVSELEFVTTDGDIIHLNDKTTDKNEKDLYWGLRGAGGGNFGIVTNINLQLQKTPEPRLMMGQVAFPFYRIEEILKFYNDWVVTLPNEMAVYGMLRRFPDPRRGGQPVLSLRFTPVYNGPMAKGIELLKPLIEMKPSSVELYNMSLPEWENFIGTATQIKGNAAYIRSCVLDGGSLTNDVATFCKQYMSRSPSPDSYVVWTHKGGKVKENGEASSYAHRNAEFTFELKSVWNEAQPQLARPNIEWAVKFFDDLGKHAQGSYVNYIDPLLMDWQKNYYKDQYDKLLKVKQYWDPKGQFNFQQGIGSDFSPTRTTPLDLSPLTRTFNV
ncbi:MAG: FAD-binding oxidoreductase [Ferruginibacter sp.]